MLGGVPTARPLFVCSKIKNELFKKIIKSYVK